MSQSYLKSYNIPENWCWAKIGNLLDVIRGASPRPKGDPRFFGGDIPWIMISDVTKSKGKFISRTRDTVTEEGSKRSRYLKKGTLILSNSGSVCIPKILAVDGCIHDGFVAFPERIENLEKLYFYYYFEYIRPLIINANRQGVTQVNLNTTIVKDIDIPLPPHPEQQRIVTKIEELFTRLDAGMETMKQVQAQLQRYRQSVLKAAVEGRLTAEWRGQHKDELEAADKLLEHILKERREKWEAEQLAKYKTQGKTPLKNWQDKYKEPTPLNTSDLPDLPEGWIWTTMDNISIKITDGEHIRPKMVKKGVPFLSAKNVQDNSIIFDGILYVSQDDAARFRQRCNPERNDILIVSRGATVSRTCVINVDKEFCLLGSVILIKPSRFLRGKFIAYMLKSSTIQKTMIELSGSTAQQAIYIRDIRNLLIPIAPMTEQEIITDKVERIFSNIEEVDMIIKTELKRGQSLRQSILKHAFDGKLVPQDPNDEPASILLERIKAEKAKPKKSKQLEMF